MRNPEGRLEPVEPKGVGGIGWSRNRRTVVAFTAMWVLAMALYPGGSSFDAGSEGHDFFRNFLCDVLSSETSDGRANRWGAGSMAVGIVILIGGGLWPLWWRVPVAQPWRTLSRILGSVAAILTGLLCMEQAFRLDLSHHRITLTAGAAGLIPTVLVAVIDWRDSNVTLARKLWLSGTLLASLVNYVSYSMVQWGSELTPLVPTSQKLALLCLLAWLFVKPVEAEV
ncbi:MAG: hypothetical protein P1V35_09335 [Planctomycetota bacterium]|nr:hypothetical protein [Planctomycetota bacterium]